jgi:LPXTG-motif cell wall-anchored protein
MSCKKIILGAALGAATLFGGSVAASDYPPDVPSASTVVSSSQSGFQRPDPIATSAAQLPATGTDSGAMIKIAGGAVVAGAGLVIVAKRRRRVAPS